MKKSVILLSALLAISTGCFAQKAEAESLGNDVQQIEKVNQAYVRVGEIGSKVPDFSLPTPDGKTINFYSFLKGKKCVIVDFWASWCFWCRKENPTVRAVYEAYKDKGCDVISVSVDTKEQAWRKALADDKPSWSQVVDYKGTKEGLYNQYNLNGIPAIFLVDAKGYIVAKDLRGEKMGEAVKNFLKL